MTKENKTTTKATIPATAGNDEKQLCNAFDNALKELSTGLQVYQTKNQRISELCFYALSLKKLYNRNDKLKTLLIDLHLYQVKAYFESIGIFTTYKASEKFLKVFVDVDGSFNTIENLVNIESFEDYQKRINIEKKENTIKNNDFFSKRLTTLFKGLSKEQQKQYFEVYFKTLKN